MNKKPVAEPTLVSKATIAGRPEKIIKSVCRVREVAFKLKSINILITFVLKCSVHFDLIEGGPALLRRLREERRDSLSTKIRCEMMCTKTF